MKIMTIFIDMISGEKLNLCNSNAERTELDDFIDKFGGTLYANCFTPAPDTPRSAGCMWTGLYPKENGCKYRTRYPMFYMNNQRENIWDILRRKNYDFRIFMREPTLASGVLPQWVNEYAYPDGNDLDGFTDSVKLQDNSFIMIYLPDFHTYIDIFQASREGAKKGGAFIKSLLDRIFAKLNPDAFDDILLFSDHGFRVAGETHRHLLEEDRVQTLMLWRKKGQSSLTVDEKLRSNLDVFPTICEMINYTPEGDIDGKSLSGEGHEYILLEDHRNFNVELGQTIERWAVLWRGHIYWLDCAGWDMYGAPENHGFDRDKFEKIIAEKMTDYVENRRDYECIHRHDNDTWKAHTMFSDGTLLSEVEREQKECSE